MDFDREYQHKYSDHSVTLDNAANSHVSSQVWAESIQNVNLLIHLASVNCKRSTETDDTDHLSASLLLSVPVCTGC